MISYTIFIDRMIQIIQIIFINYEKHEFDLN